MPRIDPLQLLRCLSVLLSPTGGIKSKDEVQRLASLMTKFSKKLVSKCIYIQILKTTKTDLLGMFMAAGGWNLTHTWLSDAIVAKNWPLIQELLELLLMCPVDVERLKANNCPKLIKGLSRDSPNESVKLLASKLVEQWLKIVKGETEAVKAQNAVSSEPKPPAVADVVKMEPISPSETVKVKEEPSWNESKPKVEPPAPVKHENIAAKHENIPVKFENLEPKVEIQKLVIKTDESGEANVTGAADAPGGQLPVYKITIKDGKGVLAKVISGDKSPTQKESSASVSETEEVVAVKPKVSEHLPPPVKKEDIKKEVEDVKVNVEPQKISSAKPKVKPDNVDSTKAIKEVSKKSKDSQSSSKSDRDKKSSKEKIRDKERSREKSRDRDKDRENSKVKDKKSSSSSSLNCDKGNGISEKDKATLAKLIPPAISKLGKIPKKPRTEESAKSSQSPTSDSKKPAPSEVRKPVPPPEPPVTKKPSISIETRKLGDPSNRPKTVKTFNSKFRSTGLEEEAKPPPSRVKKPAPLMEKKAFPPPPLKVPSLKRPSPPKETPVPEKKLKASVPEATADETKKEKTGGIKLIPPRPKPSFLQESDMFMDALTASSKKEPRKRKRRISSSKDGPETKKESPVLAKEDENNKDSTPPSSPQNNEEIKSPPIVRPLLKFYQDTMETNEEEKEEETAKENEKIVENQESAELKGNEETETPPTPTDNELNENGASKEAEVSEEQKRRSSKEDSPIENENSSEEVKQDEAHGKYPKGVLIYHKLRKGPKKSVRWKAEKELETIKYFELDETERVNVTKTFMDMKQIERSNEREGFLLARKLPQDDIMEEKMTWQPLIPLDLPPCLVEPGSRSREKDVQYAREKVTLQALYFSRSMIPDSAAEPDMEIHPTTDPTIIPLDDVTGNPDSVNDFQNTPWPEPKPMIIPQSPPPQFQQPQPPFNQFGQNPQGFQGSGPPQMFPPNHQGGMPNNMPPVPIPNNVGPMNNMPPSGGGDWRTGDGKVVPVNEMPMQMDMYGPGGPPPMGMGMPAMPGMGGPGPDMNFGMMPGEDMGPGGPFPPHQGFPMGGGGGPPPPGMFPYQGGNSGGGGGGGGGGRGGRDMRRGRGGPRGNGPWFQSNGPHWHGGRGGSGGGGRGGRGNWGGQNRAVCKHFRGGYCRMAEKCPYLHPGVNGPSY